MLRIGTRSSKLALWQAQWVASQLVQRGFEVELVEIATVGDTSMAPLGQIGGQGVFTKEIQRSLLAGQIDVAVHSLKDLPTLQDEGLLLAAVPSRETTADCLISRMGLRFEQLDAGARIGTGSARRAAQLRAWRSDISIVDIRGNVDSRLRKLDEGGFDAIVLAAAGLTRLKLLGRVTEYLPQDRVLPAVGQGALGLECRREDVVTKQAILKLNDPDSQAAVLAERALLRALSAGCLAPVAALANARNGELVLRGRVLSVNGKSVLDASVAGISQEAEALGSQLAEDLLRMGAAELMA